MEPTGITLDDATVKLLTTANGHPLPLRNTSGVVVGYFTPKEPDPWTQEEMDRLEEEIANDPRPDVSHEDVLRWVKEL